MVTTSDDLARILARNPALTVGSAGTDAVVERTVSVGALATSKAQEGDTRRFLVRITSVRQRLLDEDNLAPKYHVDCLRYAGVIPDDNPGQVSIQTTQRKAAKGETERTIVEVVRLS